MCRAINLSDFGGTINLLETKIIRHGVDRSQRGFGRAVSNPWERKHNTHLTYISERLRSKNQRQMWSHHFY